MTLPSSILIYGHDPMLLDVRRWVLEKAGFMVTTTSGLSAVIEAMTAEAPQILVLCHTLTADERRASIAAAAGYQPAIKTLSICTNRWRGEENGISGETLDSLAGAEGLIAATKKMSE